MLPLVVSWVPTASYHTMQQGLVSLFTALNGFRICKGRSCHVSATISRRITLVTHYTLRIDIMKNNISFGAEMNMVRMIGLVVMTEKMMTMNRLRT